MITDDVFFVSGIAFMITPANKLKFVTFENITSQTDEQVIKI